MTSPAAFDEADELVIDEDAFRFFGEIFLGEVFSDTDDDPDDDADDDPDDFVEWESSLPFSEIAELRFDSSTWIVSGTLKDGSELNFYIEFNHSIKRDDPQMEAMQSVAALFAPETSVATPDETGADAEGPLEWSRSLDVGFATAALSGVEAQIRRFARITSAAGLDVATRTGGSISALWPGTRDIVFEMDVGVFAGSWKVHRTGAFGKKQSEAKKTLPKMKFFASGSAAKADQFLDALEAFLVTHHLAEAPDHLKIDIGELRHKVRLVHRVRRPAPGSPVLSDEEFETAIRSLQPAFDDAAECGAEPQMRRFAELTAFVGLHVNWDKESRDLVARWKERKQQTPIFTLRCESDGRFEAILAGHTSLGYGGDSLDSVTSPACRAFGVEVWELNRALPLVGWTASMDTQQTDRFLNALEVFLTSHSLPYKTN